MARPVPPRHAYIQNNWRKGAMCLLVLILGGAIGWLLNSYITSKSAPKIAFVRDSQNQFKLVNPLLLIQLPESDSFPKYSALKDALTQAADQQKNQEGLTGISIYFRDMDSNQWVGVNEAEKFSPASMLKVVTLVSLLHASEGFPQMLTGSILIPPNSRRTNTQDYYPPSTPIVPGKTYSVRELMQKTIAESDNLANSALFGYIGPSELARTFESLQLPIPTTSSADDYTPREYSRLFRVLYNSTYLTPALSEQALELLSHTTFTQGLVAGVPATTVVAHKFGERTSYDSNGTVTERELHDCGIVYYPGHPYFLCIMTRGDSFPKLSKAISSISHTAWIEYEKTNENKP